MRDEQLKLDILASYAVEMVGLVMSDGVIEYNRFLNITLVSLNYKCQLKICFNLSSSYPLTTALIICHRVVPIFPSVRIN